MYVKEKQANLEVTLAFTVLILSAHVTFSFNYFHIGSLSVPQFDLTFLKKNF